jgi:hypothetical protein
MAQEPSQVFMVRDETYAAEEAPPEESLIVYIGPSAKYDEEVSRGRRDAAEKCGWKLTKRLVAVHGPSQRPAHEPRGDGRPPDCALRLYQICHPDSGAEHHDGKPRSLRFVLSRARGCLAGSRLLQRSSAWQLLSASLSEPDDSLLQSLKFLYRAFCFYHGSIGCIKDAS